jgi:hypothetical protein
VGQELEHTDGDLRELDAVEVLDFTADAMSFSDPIYGYVYIAS